VSAGARWVRGAWRRARPARHALAAGLLRLLEDISGRSPWLSARLGGGLGVGVGVALWLCGARLARVALEGQRRLSAPSQPLHPRALAALYCAAWADLGRRAGEWLAAPATLELARVSPALEALIAEAREGGARGEVWVALTSHYGHWELLGAALAARGAPFVAVASTPSRGPLGAWLTARRARLGVRVTHAGAAREVLRGLLSPQRARTEGSGAAGGAGALCFLIDQSVQGRARPLPFLGAPAPTADLPARLIASARRRGLRTRVIWLEAPRARCGRYELSAEDLSAHADPVARATERLEALVRRSPAQWVWLNDRWRPRGARGR
jgi:KDO2-lipid IV(A) lauroyltransferase